MDSIDIHMETIKPAYRPKDGLHPPQERQRSAGRAVPADGRVRNVTIHLRKSVPYWSSLERGKNEL